MFVPHENYSLYLETANQGQRNEWMTNLWPSWKVHSNI